MSFQHFQKRSVSAIRATLLPSAIAIIFIFTTSLISPASAEDKVKDILTMADAWIISDTTRILDLIHENNHEAVAKLTASPHWQSTYDDLSFLLSIDYVGDPQLNKIGRMYYVMRITGQTDALFYAHEPMGFPHQLTPNNWDDSGYHIGYFRVHLSGKFILVATHLHGNENYDI